MPVNFIAEVSSNHNRDLDRCLSFVEKSAEIGCAAVKFQLFKIDQLFTSEVLQASEEHRRRIDWELPVEFLPELTEACRKANIQFACTPFYLKAVEELFPYVQFYKIASYELLWNDLLIECAKTDKPVVLSTGMATLKEIRNAVEILRNTGCNELTLLQCVSGYPTPVLEANLAAIETLRHNFHVQAGWSDHTVTPGVIYRAVHKWQASAIEFHLDLEGLGAEYETGHCWLPGSIEHVIRTINEGLLSDGTGEKLPAPVELPDRDWRADPEDGLRPLKQRR
ncbi:MAG: N-acetylneuraminic acid synthase [Caldithrix sp.]|nr:MAG: N-acetylneuraminic acid synthase [Caldithrix sp.]